MTLLFREQSRGIQNMCLAVFLCYPLQLTSHHRILYDALYWVYARTPRCYCAVPFPFLVLLIRCGILFVAPALGTLGSLP